MFLRNNEGKLNLSKDVTMFGKGCCIQWGMGFLMQTQFTVCMFIFLYYLWAPYCMNWCLWKIRISKMRLLFQTTPRLLQRVVTLRNSIFNAKLFSCTCFLLAKKKYSCIGRSPVQFVYIYISLFVYYTVSWCHSCETCLSLKKIMTRHDYAYIHVVSSWFLRY